MPFCAYCGKPLPAAGTFCPSCGAAIPGAAGAPGPSPPPSYPPPGGVPPGGYGGTRFGGPPPGPTPVSRSADRRSLVFVEWASILFIVSGIVGAVFDFSGRLTGLVSASTTSQGTTVSLPSPWVWVGYLGALTAVDLATLVLLRVSFRSLAPLDRRFSAPATLAWVALFGAVLVLIGAGLLLVGLYQAVSCVGSGNPLTRGCLFTGVFVGGLGLAIVGGITALVGAIGILIGIWRLGSRYDESLFKVGAILLIFPLVNIVGAILMLVASRSARQKVEAMAGPPPPLGAG